MRLISWNHSRGSETIRIHSYYTGYVRGRLERYQGITFSENGLLK
jgi:hypothetical protein